jgi:hypothetical protein
MMMRFLTRPVLILVIALVFQWFGFGISEEENNFMKQIKRKYDSLTPKGKFAASCTLSFVGSRIALNTAVKCIKIGAAAFIT